MSGGHLFAAGLDGSNTLLLQISTLGRKTGGDNLLWFKFGVFL